MIYQGAPVNELHALLRQSDVHDGIALIWVEINKRGHDVVKNDPGVYASIMENRAALVPFASKGGLGGASRH